MATCLAAFALLAVSALSRGDPLRYENEGLVTRINCQAREPQHFLYSSVTDLWGSTGGRIALSADVALLCMGDDSGGKYGLEALKYRVEIANLLISENGDNKMQSMVREKRGAKEFFSRSWTEVKDFFKRVFGRKPSPQPEVSRAAHPDPTETPTTEEPEEDLDVSDLYSAPFQFVQLANGSIPEILFAENEVDTRVKNFKRHLVDAFSTHLSFDKRERRVVEKSVIGEHTSNYNISVSGEKASLSLDDESAPKPDKPRVVVTKTVTGEDILKLAPSTAVNDPHRMDLKLEQVQIFQEGHMVQSSGISSLTLMPDSDKDSNRVKREDAHDVTTYLQAQTTFDIQLQTRERRSSPYSVPEDKDEDVRYLSASRIAEMEDHTERWKMRFLPDPDIDTEAILKSLLEQKDTNYDEKLQALFEIVEREVSLELDKENNSVSNTARKVLSEEAMQDLCLKEFSACKDFLQLLAVAGGDAAEKVFLSLLSAGTGLSTENLRMVADIVSDVPRPSAGFLHALISMLEGSSAGPGVRTTLTISLGHLASEAAPEGKEEVSDLFTNLLRQRHDGCELDPTVMNVLEGIGNLKSDRVAVDVLEVSKLCRNNSTVEIACAHALRHSSHLPLVQQWIQNATAEGDCELLSEIVASLTDTVQDQEMTPDEALWPRFGFNDVDHLLKTHLASSNCSHEEIVLYFRRKKSAEANAIAENYFGPESEPWNPRSRQKRSVWDDLNCQDWTEDVKFVSIQEREEFASDRATYNKRRSCLGFKRLGLKGANAEVYAGVFAGVQEPSSPLQYKLFTKFVSQLNFLGQELQIGSFRFYHQNGKMNANVKIMGRTRQEFNHDGCTPTDLTYRPLKHVPLFDVNIGIAQLSLGLQISSQLGIVTSCPPGGQEYVLEPRTSVRVGGEALGTVLFMRGAANLGGSFNYKLQFGFAPSPDMCLKGSHGYDPMNISFETYYQFWNKLKDDWGRARTWKPGFMSWNITRGDIKPWFKDTCIAPKASSGPFSNSERELE